MVAIVIVLALGTGVAMLLSRPGYSPTSQNPTSTPPITTPPGNPPSSQTLPASQSTTLKGVSLSPKSYGGADFSSFFEMANLAGSIITWSGDWAELSNPKGAPYVVAQLAEQRGIKPIIIAQFFTQDTGTLLRPLNATVRKGYLDGACAFAREFKPEYMGLGIEVNALHEKNPTEYSAFVSLFADVASSVRNVSPDTKVFTVFQLERLKGLRGGLYGGLNDPSSNDWGLLADFPSSDLLAFTTYPCIVYKDPSEVAPDYYVEIASHTQTPVAFTEAGWFRTGPVGWESSPGEQAAFVAEYIELTSPLKPRLLVWSFLYDQPVQDPFSSMGLLSVDGSEAPGWEAWIAK